jgi:hypothetical protein
VKQANIADMSLLEHFGKIIDYSSKDGLTEPFWNRAKTHLEVVFNVLHLPPLQAALFAHFLNRCDDQAITTESIAESIKCNKIQLIKYMDEFDELEKKKLIRCNRGGHSHFHEFAHGMPTYRVPNEVIIAIRKGVEYKGAVQKNCSISEFFCILESFFSERCDGELTYDALAGEIKTLLDINDHLLFSKRIKWHRLPDEDLLLLLRFCDLFVNEDDDGIGIHNIREIYEKKSDVRDIERLLKSGRHILMDSGLVENANNYGMGDPEYFKLTDKAKQELLEELDIKVKTNVRGKDFILSNSLNEKKLFYNAKTASQIEELCSLLRPENFKSVEKRLDEKNMRKGFACLFYGPPGTGKTETVFQIARQTGRDILLVDISETKSKWFGESEKRIKQIFNRYRAAVKMDETMPILLFNESDAVIGKRMEFGNEAHSVDQTENAIQNIILQEIENLEGILIATSNLTQNMDGAFERRFLYKIEFEKPNKKSRSLIWKSIIPELSEEQALALSARYEFSGGQIENIARKRTVDYIVRGNDLSLEKLDAFCKEELLVKGPGKIGFCV